MAPSDPSSPATPADAALGTARTPSQRASQPPTSSYLPPPQPDLLSFAHHPRSTAQTGHDDTHARRVSRKLQKRRRDGEHTPTMELPERLKDHGEQAESEEEVLQPQGYAGGMFMNMNQSIFGLIAAAGSQVDFADRFGGQSSDDDDEADGQMAMTIAEGKAPAPSRESLSFGGLGGPLAQTTILRKNAPAGGKSEGRHRRKLSENRLLRSVQGLTRLSSKSKSSSSKSSKQKDSAAAADKNQITEAEDEDEQTQPPSAGTTSQGRGVPPGIEITRIDSAPRLAPVMSRMLEARAEMAARPSFDLERLSSDMRRDGDLGETGPTELAKKLKEIFEFDKPEEVIEGKANPIHSKTNLIGDIANTTRRLVEYPCWLLQHVLLQGYMYITTNHIAFYAYLPKKAVRATTSRKYVTSLGYTNTHNSTRSPSLAISPKAASGIPSSTATGSDSKAMFCRITAIPRISTFPAARSTSDTASQPASPTRTRRACTSRSPRTTAATTSRPTVPRAPKSGLRACNGSSSGRTTTVTASRSRFLSRM